MASRDDVLLKIADSLEKLGGRIDRVERQERVRHDDLAAQKKYKQMMANQVEMSDLQSRADDALGVWNIRAPSPSADDTRRSYRIRLLNLASRQLPPADELRRLDLRTLGNDVIDVFEPKILEACKCAVNRVDTLAPSQEREIKHERDGRKFSEFVAEKSFVVNMQADNRRVTQFAKRDGSFRED